MVDDVRIVVQAGDGGGGAVSFLHLKFMSKGGPDGGDGGHGGSVYLVGNKDLNTLQHFRGANIFRAETGGHGGGNKMHGRNGDDIDVAVPLGTVIEGVGEIVKDGERLRVARGGKGGRGNEAFKSSVNQTPRYAEPGGVGEKFELHLELKLLANVGFVGFPNAGKSTLLSVLTRATPEIANYPFTTLSPNLGVLFSKDKTASLILADIPGLIEGAAQGKGLGHEFLKHIERCSILLFVLALDDSVLFDADALAKEKAKTLTEQLTILKKELKEFLPDMLKKKSFVCINKCDVYDAAVKKEMKKIFPRALFISAATHDGVEALRDKLFTI